MKLFYIIIFFISGTFAHAQPPTTTKQEQQLENLAERDDAVIEDDVILEQLEIFRRHPINLNTAEADDLQLLQFVNAMQVQALIQYRKLLGKFIHLYELQAIPHWDVFTIQRIMPYVTIREEISVTTRVKTALNEGNASLLFRWSRPAQKTESLSENNKYNGSPDKMFVRYKYNYKNLLQFGVLGDKDAGEQITFGKRRYGFDFYSFHFFARKWGIVQSLAIGDFTVNMGQGLIQWQGMAFGKGELTAIKRQSAVIRPYNSAGEFNFHRGAAIHLQKKHLQLIAFCSFRRLDANIAVDSVGGSTISSFITSGMHRSANELAERNNIYQQAAGGTISYEHARWLVGANIIQYHFSLPVQKRDEPYNLFSFRGDRWTAFSVHYEHTYRNLHVFGEAAADQRLNKAFINGFLLSLHRRMDMSILLRHIEPGYQPFNGSAFTEGSRPNNETGFFIGLGCRPFGRVRIDAYADVFRFPWLKLRNDAPSEGKEYQLQLTWQPRKTIELSTRFRSRNVQGNTESGANPFHGMATIPKTNWRAQVSWQPATEWQTSHRVELVWYGRGDEKEQGYLLYADVRYKRADRPWALSGRIQLFETDGFDSRIYAFEQDVPATVSAVYHKGIRYYFVLQLDVGKRLRERVYRSLPRIEIWTKVSGGIAETQAGTASQPTAPQCKIQVIFWWD